MVKIRKRTHLILGVAQLIYVTEFLSLMKCCSLNKLICVLRGQNEFTEHQKF